MSKTEAERFLEDYKARRELMEAVERVFDSNPDAAEADLWIMNLETGEDRPLDEVNDRYAESFHNWSSNGRWLAFSSRREEGQYARVYFAHVDADGRAAKPFVLPQENPLHNRQNFRAYNVPEFIVEPIPFSKREIFNAARGTGENTTGSGQARTQNSAEIETYFN